ncbi:MAG: transposase family protein [Tannerella sp.]|jgi:hypothetical protein|nr:transposase family protein [Tannerella sp.]
MESLQNYLSGITDFRIRKRLGDILFTGLLTYLGSGEDYGDMVLSSKTHGTYLREFIGLPDGIPSHDTFNRVFSVLEPDLLRKCLYDCGKDITGLLTIKTLIKMEVSRMMKDREMKETRYCISDGEGMGSACFNALVGGHRGSGIICTGIWT